MDDISIHSPQTFRSFFSVEDNQNIRITINALYDFCYLSFNLIFLFIFSCVCVQHFFELPASKNNLSCQYPVDFAQSVYALYTHFKGTVEAR